jgi:hypothetical protein
MDEVLTLTVSKTGKEGSGLISWDIGLQSEQAIDSENRVVEIAFACAIFEPSIVVLFAAKKITDQIRRLAQ